MVGRVRLAPKGTLTVRQTCEMFGVSRVTIHAWRVKRGMPHDLIPCNEQYGIRFNESAVRRWAAEQGIAIPGENHDR